MSNDRTQDIDKDASVRPAHPAQPESPRPLGRDGLPQRDEALEERVRRDRSSTDEQQRPVGGRSA